MEPPFEGFEFLEEVALADVAFRARAPDLAGVFRAAARATIGVMVDGLDQDQVHARWEQRTARAQRLELTAAAADLLLYDFLSEIVFRKDAEGLLLLPAALSVSEPGPGRARWHLDADLTGVPVRADGLQLLVDVKAVTMHRLRLEPADGGWVAEVVLDI